MYVHLSNLVFEIDQRDGLVKLMIFFKKESKRLFTRQFFFHFSSLFSGMHEKFQTDRMSEGGKIFVRKRFKIEKHFCRILYYYGFIDMRDCFKTKYI